MVAIEKLQCGKEHNPVASKKQCEIKHNYENHLNIRIFRACFANHWL